MRKADPRSFVGVLWLVTSILLATGQCFAEKGINDALIKAATRGDLSDVNTILDKGADVNSRDQFGRTALHWASLGGQPEVARLLLANGADPKAVDDQGHSALHVACAMHNHEVAKLLVDNGADVNQKDRKERTPLAWVLNTAGGGPYWSTAGGVYSIDNEAGVNRLHWEDIHCEFSQSNYKKLIELLKAAGAEQ